MEVIVTFIKPGDELYAHLYSFSVLPRKDELICLGGFDHQWWRVMEVVHIRRGGQLEIAMQEPEFAMVVEPAEPLGVAFLKKADAR